MIEPVGKILEQTRRQKNLSVDDVARATKIHRNRIIDLENDEYGNFPNLSYARSFLLLYAKHLGVDVREAAGSFERHNQIGINDYEYLTNTPQERPMVLVDKPRNPFLPLLVTVAAVVVALGAAFFIINVQRLGYLHSVTGHVKPPVVEATPARPSEVTPAATPAPSSLASIGRSVEPVILGSPLATSRPSATGSPSATPAVPAPEESIEVRRAVPVATTKESTSAPENEVILQPLKKTWVKVQQGDSRSPVVFEDFLYPNARPLTLRGDRFYIEADADGTNLRITRNGQDIAYTPPGLEIR